MKELDRLKNEALTMIESTPGEQQGTPAFAARLNNLAVVHQNERQFLNADLLYKQSLGIWERTLGPSHPRIAQSLSNRASLYRQMREFHEAERVYQLALKFWYEHAWPTEAEMEQSDIKNDSPLWAEHIGAGGTTIRFRASVRQLREGVESGSNEARVELVEILRKLGPWFHNLNYGGINTVPHDPGYPERRWRVLEPFLPNDLSGKTVLDIGCNGGFLSLEMKKRNAERVVSIDFMPHLLAQTRFASYWFDLPIEPRHVDVYDVESLKTQFDIVIFVEVLYHLKHPLYALEKVANVCKETLLFQSLMRGPGGDFEPADNYAHDDMSFFLNPKFPKMYFLEKSFHNDSSNWWMANQSCLMAMLRTCGFGRIQIASDPDHFVCRKD